MDRYARSRSLIGEEGQSLLQKGRVLIVGLGGLGCPAALYLAAAGVGTIGLLDHDMVEESNLARQILHTVPGVKKTTSARQALEKVNPSVRIHEHTVRLTEENIDILKGYDVILDCVDDSQTKLMLNRAAFDLGVPLVYGAAIRDEGQVAVLRGRPCLACFFKSASGTCAQEGILPPTAGLIGVMQAREALHLLLHQPTLDGLLVLDAHGVRTVGLHARASCEVCGLKPALPKNDMDTITPKELQPLLEEKKVILIDVREQWEWDICHIKGAMLIPLHELPAQVGALDKHKDIVFYCHTGQRSGHATRHFNQLGFHARNLLGGIARWTDEVDQSLERY